jgi:DNA polymerase I
MILFFDTETNDFNLDLIKTIHCMNVYHGTEKRHFRFDPKGLPMPVGVKMLQDADAVVAHNAIPFDVPVLQKFYPEFKPKKVYDTLTLARLAWPDIGASDHARHQNGTLPGNLIGSHSLEAWGFRLGVYKGTFHKTTDWAQWSPEMSDYCEQDVVVLIRLFEKIMEKKLKPEVMDMELDVQKIIYRQEKYGFLFDVEKAQAFYVKLVKERDELLKELQDIFPPFYKPDGKLFTPKRDNKKLGYVAGAECQKIKSTEFNPTSSQHIYVALRRKYQWEPTEFTEKSVIPEQWRHLFASYYRGQLGLTGFPEPTINDEVLAKLEYPEAQRLARALMVQKRIGQIAEGNEAWLKQVHEKTNRMHGRINTLRAVTRRMAHYNPNMGQVPNVDSPYGPECREMFTVPEKKVLVGVDASGLEARCQAHYMARYDGGAFIKTILEGKKEDGTELHTKNATTLKLPRTDAKTWYYAWLYGAGDAKLGRIGKKDEAYGKKMRGLFLKANPAIETLLKDIKSAVKNKGYLLSIDGTPLHVRSMHSALNTLLQSCGAIVMKKALVIFDQKLQALGHIPGTHYEFVANVHDEWQIETDESIAETVGKLGVASIREAGEYFKFRCQLDGEYKIGRNWKETH